jgi:hypothetical protein
VCKYLDCGCGLFSQLQQLLVALFYFFVQTLYV